MCQNFARNQPTHSPAALADDSLCLTVPGCTRDTEARCPVTAAVRRLSFAYTQVMHTVCLIRYQVHKCLFHHGLVSFSLHRSLAQRLAQTPAFVVCSFLPILMGQHHAYPAKWGTRITALSRPLTESDL